MAEICVKWTPDRTADPDDFFEFRRFHRGDIICAHPDNFSGWGTEQLAGGPFRIIRIPPLAIGAARALAAQEDISALIKPNGPRLKQRVRIRRIDFSNWTVQIRQDIHNMVQGPIYTLTSKPTFDGAIKQYPQSNPDPLVIG